MEKHPGKFHVENSTCHVTLVWPWLWPWPKYRASREKWKNILENFILLQKLRCKLFTKYWFFAFYHCFMSV